MSCQKCGGEHSTMACEASPFSIPAAAKDLAELKKLNRETNEATVMKYIATPISISVHPANQNPILCETATIVTLVDDGAGAFIELSQPSSPDTKAISIDPDELDVIIHAARTLLAQKPTP